MDRPLNEIMEFDQVIEVKPDGSVVDGPVGLYAPNLLDENLDSHPQQWTLLDGYSGQYGYSGPIMHPSEYIGGRMEQDILAEPGYYVAVVANYSPDDESEELSTEGWAVAYLPIASEG